MTPAYLASPQAMDDLRELNARFIDNFVTNDVASHDALLHAEFIGVRSDGTRIGRAPYLEQWATGFDPEINFNGTSNFSTAEFLTQPHVRYFTARVSIGW